MNALSFLLLIQFEVTFATTRLAFHLSLIQKTFCGSQSSNFFVDIHEVILIIYICKILVNVDWKENR